MAETPCLFLVLLFLGLYIEILIKRRSMIELIVIEFERLLNKWLTALSGLSDISLYHLNSNI